MLIQTNLILQPYDAVTVWPFIFIRPECKNDTALIAHEMVHYRSMAWLTPIWGAWYFLSKKFRWAQEVQAYRVQVALGGISVERAAEMLCTYRTGHTFEQALDALEGNHD